MARLKMLIAATHPIQYQAPWFRALHRSPEVELNVVFGLLPSASEQGRGFGVPFQWDTPILEGYRWRVIASARRLPTLGGFFGNCLENVETEMSELRPDVLVLTGWQSLGLMQILQVGLRLQIPVLVRGDSNQLKYRSWFLRCCHRALLSGFDGFLVVGKANRAFYRANGVRSDALFDCPHFVENDRFVAQMTELAPDRAVLRARWMIPEESFCFLFCGKLESKKRFFDLLSAFVRTVAANPAVHLLVVGDGIERLEGERRVSEGALPVTFAGFLNQTEITKAYVAADCLVLPSDFGETWGLVVNEAMVCGVPAIVSDRVGCGPDLVEEGVTGSVFRFGNIEALAERLLWFATHRISADIMGGNAAQRVKEYSVERAVDGTIEAARSVLAVRRGTVNT